MQIYVMILALHTIMCVVDACVYYRMLSICSYVYCVRVMFVIFILHNKDCSEDDWNGDDWKNLGEAVEDNTCLKSFLVSTVEPVPAVFIEHLCVKETLTELSIATIEVTDYSKLVMVPAKN